MQTVKLEIILADEEEEVLFEYLEECQQREIENNKTRKKQLDVWQKKEMGDVLKTIVYKNVKAIMAQKDVNCVLEVLKALQDEEVE